MLTEDIWSAGTHPLDMLEYVVIHATRRKLRMFAAGCCRGMGEVQAAEIIERFADRRIEANELRTRIEALPVQRGRLYGSRRSSPRRICPYAQALGVVQAAIEAEARVAAMEAARRAFPQLQGSLTELVLEIFGNPFLEITFHPMWLTPTVTAVAQTIYEERCFEDMTILADALEEAGCTSEEFLAHCRQPTPHARGCWVVDLLLGKPGLQERY